MTTLLPYSLLSHFIFQTGIYAHYVTKANGDYYDRLNVTLHVHTPSQVFPFLDVEAALGAENNVYSTNFSVRTNSSEIEAAASAEVNEIIT